MAPESAVTMIVTWARSREKERDSRPYTAACDVTRPRTTVAVANSTGRLHHCLAQKADANNNKLKHLCLIVGLVELRFIISGSRMSAWVKYVCVWFS